MKKKSKHKVKTVVLIGIALIILTVAIVVYMHELRKATLNATISTMGELAENDLKSIIAELNSLWNELDQINNRLQGEDPKTIQDACVFLSKEQVATNKYDILYIVSDKGIIYSGSNLVADESNNTCIKELLSGKEKFVKSYKGILLPEINAQYLAMGITCEPFEIDGNRIIGIIGYSQVKNIENTLKISILNEQGYTTLIDEEGYYVVNLDRNTGIGSRDNLFEHLEKSGDILAIEKIKESILLGKPYFSKINCEIHGKDIIYVLHGEDIGWSLVLTAPEAVVTETTQYYIIMAVLLLTVVTAVVALMIFIIARISMESVAVKADAKARSSFLSNMSHEIRTPLNGIIGLNQLMQQNVENIPLMREYLEKSMSSSKYLLSLINDILDASKLDADKMVINNEAFSIESMISDIKSIMDSKIEDKNINFKITSNIVSDAILGDQTRIEQILLNILSNAVKFTDERGNIDFRINQNIKNDEFVETIYEIEDNGCGMSEEFQKKIFEAFSQEENNNYKSSNGTGIGMTISSLLTQKMNGDISVKSKLGEGSCFRLVLTNKISNEKINEKGKEQEEINKNEKKLNILIAEDNELNAEILMSLLKNEGISTRLASDGEEVIKIFEESEPYFYDVILMDVQMPKYNGYEATKKIRQMERADAQSVIIYACTANTFDEDKERANESGMNDFVTKPIDIKILMKKLRTEKGK